MELASSFPSSGLGTHAAKLRFASEARARDALLPGSRASGLCYQAGLVTRSNSGPATGTQVQSGELFESRQTFFSLRRSGVRPSLLPARMTNLPRTGRRICQVRDRNTHWLAAAIIPAAGFFRVWEPRSMLEAWCTANQG
jgi:hypothetical protein